MMRVLMFMMSMSDSRQVLRLTWKASGSGKLTSLIGTGPASCWRSCGCSSSTKCWQSEYFGHFGTFSSTQKNLSVILGGWISVVLDGCDHTGTSLTPVLEANVLSGFRLAKNDREPSSRLYPFYGTGQVKRLSISPSVVEW